MCFLAVLSCRRKLVYQCRTYVASLLCDNQNNEFYSAGLGRAGVIWPMTKDTTRQTFISTTHDTILHAVIHGKKGDAWTILWNKLQRFIM